MKNMEIFIISSLAALTLFIFATLGAMLLDRRPRRSMLQRTDSPRGRALVQELRGANSAMTWQRAEDVTPVIGEMYLVVTNGAEWRDNDLELLPAPLLKNYLRPNIVRGRPVWVALVRRPT